MAGCEQTEKHGVVDRVADCVRVAVPEATEGQRIADQIDAAFVFARANLKKH